MENKNRIQTEIEETQRIQTVVETASATISTQIETKTNETQADDIENMWENIKVLHTSLDEYVYLGKIASGGESFVVKCNSKMNGIVAVKIYFRIDNLDLSKRNRFIQFTRRKDAQLYLLPIVDSEIIDYSGKKYYLEVQRFCESGDMGQYVNSKVKWDFESLRGFVIHLNNDLKYIHDAGYLHMDIKPENIYFVYDSKNNDSGRYVLGDFGIVREISGGNTVTLMTHTDKSINGTPGYQAPEILYGVAYRKWNSKVDYYALAVTVASLFSGKFVFANREGYYDGIKFQNSADNSHIEITRDDEDVENIKKLSILIDGMFQHDSKDRFGYEEVCRWIKNPNDLLLNRNSKNKKGWLVPFTGNSENDYIYNARDLFKWVYNNWESAKRRLYNQSLGMHYDNNGISFVSEKLSVLIEEKYPRKNVHGDKAIFETCYLIYHDTDAPLVWKGKNWNSLQNLADDILDELNGYHEELFQEKLISYWIKNINLDCNQNQLKLINRIEEYAQKKIKIACYWFAYLFASKTSIRINGKNYDNTIDLMTSLVSSPKAFYKLNGTLDYLFDLDKSSQLYGFICSGGIKRIGCSEYIIRFIDNIPKDINIKINFLLQTFEQIGIAIEDKEFVEKVRRFYLYYGPFGDIYYLHKLVNETHYYSSDYDSGKEILEEIKRTPYVQLSSIADMSVKLHELQELFDKLHMNMQNDPKLAMAGIYGATTIKCSNLNGYFLYKHLGRLVPLGYKNVIDEKC